MKVEKGKSGEGEKWKYLSDQVGKYVGGWEPGRTGLAPRRLPQASRVLARGAHRVGEYAGQLSRVLQQCGVVANPRIAQILEPVHAFVRFLEHGPKLRLKLGTRPSPPGCSVVVTHRPRGASDLCRGLLRLGGTRKLATEFDDPLCEESGSFDEIVRHVR